MVKVIDMFRRHTSWERRGHYQKPQSPCRLSFSSPIVEADTCTFPYTSSVESKYIFSSIMTVKQGEQKEFHAVDIVTPVVNCYLDHLWRIFIWLWSLINSYYISALSSVTLSLYFPYQALRGGLYIMKFMPGSHHLIRHMIERVSSCTLK